MDGLKDIKPLVAVPDVSVYYFIALVLGVLVVLGLVVIGILKWMRNRKPNLEKRAREILSHLEYEDAKQSAYTISKWAHYLADTDAKKRLHVELIQSLEMYKYKRDVPAFSEEAKARVKAYVEACG